MLAHSALSGAIQRDISDVQVADVQRELRVLRLTEGILDRRLPTAIPLQFAAVSALRRQPASQQRPESLFQSGQLRLPGPE
jgi:hypothetical protein